MPNANSISWDTATMAELYIQQNELHKAISIYRKIVRDNPSELEATQRLKELEEWFDEEHGVPTSFRQYTKKVVEQVPGTIACTIMGFDGLPIDSYQVGGSTLDIVGLLTEYSGLAAQLKRIGEEQPQIGDIRDFVVATNSVSTIFRPLTQDYFLAAVIEPTGFVGKARYLLRIITPDILTELN